MSVVIRMVFGGRHASAGAKRRTTLSNHLAHATTWRTNTNITTHPQMRLLSHTK